MEKIAKTVASVIRERSTPAKPRPTASLTSDGGKRFLEHLSFEMCGDPVLEKMALESLQFALEVRDGCLPRWLSMCGVSGTGKSHLAKGLFTYGRFLTRLQAQGDIYLGPGARLFSSRLFKWPDIVSGFACGAYGCLDDMKREWLVVIDDIGSTTTLTQLAQDKLFEVLNAREGKWTVLTSNLQYKALAEIDVRIADRLIREPNRVVACKTTSYSLRKRKKA